MTERRSAEARRREALLRIGRGERPPGPDRREWLFFAAVLVVTVAIAVLVVLGVGWVRHP